MVAPENSLTVLVMIISKSVSICNRSHSTRANSGKITIYWGGTLLWCPSLREISPSGMKFARKKLETVKLGVSISPGLGSVPGRVSRTNGRTDGQTDRITIASICA